MRRHERCSHLPPAHRIYLIIKRTHYRVITRNLHTHTHTVVRKRVGHRVTSSCHRNANNPRTRADDARKQNVCSAFTFIICHAMPQRFVSTANNYAKYVHERSQCNVIPTRRLSHGHSWYRVVLSTPPPPSPSSSSHQWDFIGPHN